MTMITKLLSSTAALKTLAVTCLLCAFSPASPIASNAFAQSQHGIAATVNDEVITTHDLRQRVLFLIMTTGATPDEATLQRLQVQALQSLVDEHIQIQEAKKFDLEISDAEVERSVTRLAQGNNMSVEELSAQTAQLGVSLDTLRDQVRSEVAWQRIVNGRYGSRIRISDGQIDETMNRLTANADKPSYLVSEIFIEASEDIGGLDGAVEGALAMITQVKNGAPFTALARQFSSAATAAKGGDIGWVNQGELRSELDNAISSMEKGTLSAPITVPGGVYVLALRDSRISDSETIYRVKQVRMETTDEASSANAMASIRDMQSAGLNCETLDSSAPSFNEASTADMGEVKSSEVSPLVLDTLSKTNVGELSEPIDVANGVMALFVCERTVQGSNIPTRDEIEERLIDQQLAQQSKRYLRDLRRSATIEAR